MAWQTSLSRIVLAWFVTNKQTKQTLFACSVVTSHFCLVGCNCIGDFAGSRQEPDAWGSQKIRGLPHWAGKCYKSRYHPCLTNSSETENWETREPHLSHFMHWHSLVQTMLEDKLRETDWEVTQETIEEQVARESYLQWLRDQEKRATRHTAVRWGLVVVLQPQSTPDIWRLKLQVVVGQLLAETSVMPIFEPVLYTLAMLHSFNPIHCSLSCEQWNAWKSCKGSCLLSVTTSKVLSPLLTYCLCPCGLQSHSASAACSSSADLQQGWWESLSPSQCSPQPRTSRSPRQTPPLSPQSSPKQVQEHADMHTELPEPTATQAEVLPGEVLERVHEKSFASWQLRLFWAPVCSSLRSSRPLIQSICCMTSVNVMGVWRQRVMLIAEVLTASICRCSEIGLHLLGRGPAQLAHHFRRWWKCMVSVLTFAAFVSGSSVSSKPPHSSSNPDEGCSHNFPVEGAAGGAGAVAQFSETTSLMNDLPAHMFGEFCTQLFLQSISASLGCKTL